MASAVRVAADQALLPLLAVLACQQLHKDPAASARQSSLASVVEAPVEHLRWGLVEEMLRQLIRHLAVAMSTFTIPMLGTTRRYLTFPAAS